MVLVERVLPRDPFATLDDYVRAGGGAGLEAARTVAPEAVTGEVEASGLRGRGGAGFPTGRKWRTVVANRSSAEPSTVVVNGAEGEPGTFKDREIVRRNPYSVVEGALVAAHAIGADEVIFALKESFREQLARLRTALDEISRAGWLQGVRAIVVEGPDHYLYGEETALLEVVAGRPPFPRLAPPYRRGVDEVVVDDVASPASSGLSAHIVMAAAGDTTVAAPTLVNNVETLANVPMIVARGSVWFRELGTSGSPGTIVCTVSGDVRRAGVGEVEMGTPLRAVLEAIGGGPRKGRSIKAVLQGVSSGVIPPELLDTPLTHEAMASIGSGVGSAGFVVYDDTADMAAVAAGVSRFLAVESCGQCTPCKQDGLALADRLRQLCTNGADEHDLAITSQLLETVSDSARCYLALQHQAVVSSIVERFRSEVDAHLGGRADPTTPLLVAELAEIQGEVALVDERQAGKQPDWTYGDVDSGQAPADRLASKHAAS
jgi:NADH-quinone oxidoreductase subunit F